MAKVKHYDGSGAVPGQPLGYNIYLKVEVGATNLKTDWDTLFAAAKLVGNVTGAEVEKAS